MKPIDMAIYQTVDYSRSTNEAVPMQVTQRDLEVIRTVTRFNQMSATQIRRLFFSDQTGRGAAVVSARRLKALVEAGHLRRIRFAPEGADRGAMPWLYMHPSNLSHQAKYHALDVVDLYIAATEASRNGRLNLDFFDGEPACNLRIGGMLLRPDALLSVGGVEYVVELDRATESSVRIVEKLQRYKMAYAGNEGARPHILFVVPTEDRRRQLKRVLDGFPIGHGMSSVVQPDGFLAVLEPA